MSCLRLIELRTLLTSSRLPLLLINAQVVSKLFYCSTVWSNTPRTKFKQVTGSPKLCLSYCKRKREIRPHDSNFKGIALELLCYLDAIMAVKCMTGRALGYLSAQFIRWCDVTASRTRNSQVLLFLEQLAVKDLFIIEQSHYGILYQTILNVANHDQWAILNVALS